MATHSVSFCIDEGFELELRQLFDDPTKPLDIENGSAETRQRSSKLYSLLASLARNKALTVVKSVTIHDRFETLRQMILALRPNSNNRGLALLSATTSWHSAAVVAAWAAAFVASATWSNAVWSIAGSAIFQLKFAIKRKPRNWGWNTKARNRKCFECTCSQQLNCIEPAPRQNAIRRNLRGPGITKAKYDASLSGT